jgi:UDP-N-acetylmuramate dehydrogenase
MTEKSAISNSPAMLENEPLAPYTTLRIGGPARYFVKIHHDEELFDRFDWARHRNLPIFILGGGSNVLIADEGFPGIVLQLAITGIEWRDNEDHVRVVVGAGEDWDQFVQQCVERDLAGIECLSGIPGLVGGTPVQNVGAYGQEVSETIVAVRAFDRSTSRFIELSNAECRFGYRTSIFNTTARDRYVVTSVIFRLRLNGDPALHYPDLKNYFSKATVKPSLSIVREAVLTIRSRKAMVLNENDPDSRSAGSFFKNPVVVAEQFRQIEQIAKNRGLLREGERAPSYAAGEGLVKIPAAWLIERAGFHKGFRLGRAGISSKHTLAIVNYGEATAREVLNLVEAIQHQVREIFDVELRIEPILVGFDHH